MVMRVVKMERIRMEVVMAVEMERRGMVRDVVEH